MEVIGPGGRKLEFLAYPQKILWKFFSLAKYRRETILFSFS
jgi:hypothetical protein